MIHCISPLFIYFTKNGVFINPITFKNRHFEFFIIKLLYFFNHSKVRHGCQFWVVVWCTTKVFRFSVKANPTILHCTLVLWLCVERVVIDIISLPSSHILIWLIFSLNIFLCFIFFSIYSSLFLNHWPVGLSRLNNVLKPGCAWS